MGLPSVHWSEAYYSANVICFVSPRVWVRHRSNREKAKVNWTVALGRLCILECRGEGTQRKLATATQPQPQRNRSFQETSPISSRQLLSRLAGAHWGNLCLISCSHHLKWVCPSYLMHDYNFVHLSSAMADNNTDRVIMWRWLRRRVKRGWQPQRKHWDVN